MLGRGLEALIPPQGNVPRQAHPEPELQAPRGYPLTELPAQPREELLGPAMPAVPLMLHVHDEPSASPYVQPAAPAQSPASYADLRPESQGDSFAAQPYRYEAPAQQAQPHSEPSASYVDPQQDAQADSFAAQPYRYGAPSAPAPSAHVPTQAVSPDPRPQSRPDSYASPAYASPAPVAAPPTESYAPSRSEPVRAEQASRYADLRPESQGDSFAAQPYRVAQPATSPHEAVRPVAAQAEVPQDIYDDVRQPHEAVFQIDIDRIYPNPHQPRKTFDDAALADLAASIREFGILQPLVVRKVEHVTPNGTEVRYELIAGERRWRASRLVGLPRVPAIVRADVANKESLELAIIENLQREQLNAIEMARAYARLQDEFNMTQREVASRLGKSRETVANTLRLLDLPGDVQAAIEDGRISESHGRLLLGVTDPALQQSLFKDLLERQLTTRELRERVAAGKGRRVGPRTPRDSQPLSPELQMLQERLASELGAPVRIQASGDTGKITISFYSREELSAILERLAAEADILL